MTRFSRRGFALLACAAWSLPAFADDADRVLSIGSDVTEIVYALGAGDRLVAATPHHGSLQRPMPCPMWAICGGCHPKACCR